MKDMMIGVDLAKTVFQVHGALQTGEVQFRKKLRRALCQAARRCLTTHLSRPC